MKKLFVPILLCAALTLSACGEGGSDEAQIRALVDEMFTALKTGDYKKMKELAADDSSEMLESEEAFKMLAAMMKDAKYELSDIVVNGDEATATMKVSMTFMGEEQTQENEANFKKVDGKWRAVQ